MIDNRLNLVETFLYDTELREHVVRLLKKSHDSQRIVQKFSLGRGNADDLIALARTIEVTRGVLDLLSNSQIFDGKAGAASHHQESMQALLNKLNIPVTLAERIARSIDEEGLMLQQRIAESEAAEMAQMALTAAGLGEEAERSKTQTETEKKTKVTRKGRKMLSQKDSEKQEAWIMQKRFGNHSLTSWRIKNALILSQSI